MEFRPPALTRRRARRFEPHDIVARTVRYIVQNFPDGRGVTIGLNLDHSRLAVACNFLPLFNFHSPLIETLISEQKNELGYGGDRIRKYRGTHSPLYSNASNYVSHGIIILFDTIDNAEI